MKHDWKDFNLRSFCKVEEESKSVILAILGAKIQIFDNLIFCSFQYLSPVSGSEAAMRSRARLSSRLRSVPEKHSLLSFVQDIRRKGLESERRVSTAGMMCTTTVPVPIVPLQSSSNKNTLEPGEASSIVVKRRGTFPTHFTNKRHLCNVVYDLWRLKYVIDFVAHWDLDIPYFHDYYKFRLDWLGNFCCDLQSSAPYNRESTVVKFSGSIFKYCIESCYFRKGENWKEFSALFCEVHVAKIR